MVSLKFFLQKRKKTLQEFLLEYSITNITELNKQLLAMQLNYDVEEVVENLFKNETEITETEIETSESKEELEVVKPRKRKQLPN